MTITLLLDLDDTLLDTNIETFLPAYYGALADYLSPHVARGALMASLMSGIKQMLSNQDPSKTLQQVFEADFYPRLRVAKQHLQASIDEFYATVFPSLKAQTRPRPGASELVEWALAEGNRVAIATDPVFPRMATIQRVRWAGLDPDRFELISSFETFHFTKNHPAYFAELMGRLGWPDGPALMAGNDVDRDLRPAHAMGLATYHVQPGTGSAARVSAGTAHAAQAEMEGDLLGLRSWLGSVHLEPYTAPLKARQAVLDLLRATPAALQGLTLDLDRSTWTTEPSKEDWAMIELVCHLRDTELEVHHAQIRALLADDQPFVPRPDAAVWAKQRKYLNEDGPTAVQEFCAARLETLRKLEEQPETVWARPARHAIFGPTSFAEVIGFMADHDRMHLQQAWNTLAALSKTAHRN